jgi:hypothetical protein
MRAVEETTRRGAPAPVSLLTGGQGRQRGDCADMSSHGEADSQASGGLGGLLGRLVRKLSIGGGSWWEGSRQGIEGSEASWPGVKTLPISAKLTIADFELLKVGVWTVWSHHRETHLPTFA